MRDHKFRGKSLETGEWVTGYLYVDWCGYSILHKGECPPGYTVHVSPKTVCEFTGFSDNEDCEIYENHIVKCIYGALPDYYIGIIKMQDGCWTVDFSHLPIHKRPFDLGYQYRRSADYLKMSMLTENSIEVMGNIFDNPELLEEACKE